MEKYKPGKEYSFENEATAYGMAVTALIKIMTRPHEKGLCLILSDLNKQKTQKAN